MKYSDEQIQILRYLAECQNSSLQWKAGDVVQVPSPAIPNRTDHVVVVFPHKGGSTGNNAAGLIVRNKGRYSNRKSLELARRLATLMEEMDLGVGSVENYDNDDSRMLEGFADPNAVWMHAPRYDSAPGKLINAETASNSSPRRKRAQ